MTRITIQQYRDGGYSIDSRDVNCSKNNSSIMDASNIRDHDNSWDQGTTTAAITSGKVNSNSRGYRNIMATTAPGTLARAGMLATNWNTSIS